MRTLRNLRKIGIKDYLHQMQYIGDTKAGTYIATDKYGNKYYENLEQELPCLSLPCFPSPFKSRQQSIPLPLTVAISWVDYKQKEYDPGQIEPGWHAWMSYLVDKPPTEDPVLKTGQRSWEIPEHRPNLTASRAAFKTYST